MGCRIPEVHTTMKQIMSMKNEINQKIYFNILNFHLNYLYYIYIFNLSI